MSYDIGMEIDAGGEYPESVGEWYNYTYNVSPMFRLAFGGNGVNDLSGLTGEVAAPFLDEAIVYFHEHMDEMRDLNPSNGWGNAEGALRFLENLLTEARTHPKAVVAVR